MEAKKEVSVIIPAYNCKRTLAQAIDSALAQEVSLEVIVIDDCSSDGLMEVLEPYSSNENIRIYKNDKNMGVAATRNRGVKLAKGKYIAFLDSDDIWCKDKLKKQIELIKATGAKLCGTARELIKEDGTPTGKVIEVPQMVTYKELLKGNVINCSSVLLEAEAARKYPMESDDAHEDYITWLKLLKEYEYAVLINEPLLLYRVVKNSKSGSKLHSAAMTYKVYRRVGFGQLKSIYYFLCYAINGIRKYFLH